METRIKKLFNHYLYPTIEVTKANETTWFVRANHLVDGSRLIETWRFTKLYGEIRGGVISRNFHGLTNGDIAHIASEFIVEANNLNDSEDHGYINELIDERIDIEMAYIEEMIEGVTFNRQESLVLEKLAKLNEEEKSAKRNK